jgi:hypothetical protein
MPVFDANVTERDGGWALAWYEAIYDKAVLGMQYVGVCK